MFILSGLVLLNSVILKPCLFSIHFRTLAVLELGLLGFFFRPRQKSWDLGWEESRLSRYGIRAEGAPPPNISNNEEGQRNVLFNDALNTFYLRLYGVRHMVKDHSDNERGNPLPPDGLLFSINVKGSFICIIPRTG